jgi:hypothetical protein
MIEAVRAHLEDLYALCKRLPVRRLELFGSAATGEFVDAASDLDFIVEFLDLSPLQHGDAYFSLLHALEDLFGRPVDLVELPPPEQANPYFLKTIARSRQVIYERQGQQVPV